MHSPFTDDEWKKAESVFHSPLLQALVKKDARRLDVLTEFFSAHAVPYKVVRLKQYRHCVVTFDKRFYSPNGETKTLIAHYDRVGNEFGANDNSSACVQLAFFAKELLTEKSPHNIRFIFTDGEELNNKSIATQGAFLLGVGLRELNIHRRQNVFVFDLCGAGDTLIFSQAGIFSRDAEKVRNVKRLQQFAVQCAEKAKLPSMILPTGFSDNAGLLASGITAQLITVLPATEAVSFKKALETLQQKLSPESFTELIKKSILENTVYTSIEKIKPATWKRMHTTADSLENLTVDAFAVMRKYLHALK